MSSIPSLGYFAKAARILGCDRNAGVKETDRRRRTRALLRSEWSRAQGTPPAVAVPAFGHLSIELAAVLKCGVRLRPEFRRPPTTQAHRMDDSPPSGTQDVQE